ncbi:MAG: hypothetical protein V3U73_10910 [bacterium]
MIKPIDKALLLRKSKHLRSKEPYSAFRRRLRRPQEILTHIEENISDRGVKYEARRHYIVSMMAAFEIYWRDLLRRTIDEYELTTKQLTRVNEIKLNLLDLYRVTGEKLTVGELLTSAYSFQSHPGIEQLVGNLFKVGLYTELRLPHVEIVAGVDWKGAGAEEFNNSVIDLVVKEIIPTIDRCQMIRNHTVHDTGTLYRPSSETIGQYRLHVSVFNVFVGNGVRSIFKKHCKTA